MWEALGGEDSVHLADWPAPSGHRDAQVSSDMAALREVVRLARGIREAHGLRHRHPLPAVAIAGVRPEGIRGYAELLLDELNVKRVDVLPHADALVTRSVKLDYGRVGKRLRGAVKQVQAALDAGAYVAENPAP